MTLAPSRHNRCTPTRSMRALRASSNQPLPGQCLATPHATRRETGHTDLQPQPNARKMSSHNSRGPHIKCPRTASAMVRPPPPPRRSRARTPTAAPLSAHPAPSARSAAGSAPRPSEHAEPEHACVTEEAVVNDRLAGEFGLRPLVVPLRSSPHAWEESMIPQCGGYRCPPS